MSKYNISFGLKKKPLFEKKVKPVPIIYESDEPNIEIDSQTELSDLQKSFRERAAASEKEKEKNTNSEFWSCVVFKNKEQRDRFCELLGIKEPDLQYINGQKLIKALELRIEQVDYKPGKFKANKDILELSMKPNF